jgi:hypothetical protein
LTETRRFERFTRRLETEFKVGDTSFRGISSNFSEGGLFIRTHHSFAPGSTVEAVIYLSSDKVSRVRGVVKHALKTASGLVKNGMGVEIRKCDAQYLEFIKETVGKLTYKGPCSEGAAEGVTEKPGPARPGEERPAEAGGEARGKNECKDATEFWITKCPFCGVKNRIPVSMLLKDPLCGKCRKKLPIS